MMRTTTPKLTSLICLSAFLVVGFILLTGCTTTQEPSLDPSTVRSDNIDLWEEIGWTDMTPAEQDLWKVLGWTEDSWEGEAKKPPSEDKYWGQLTDEERSAAEKLGYTKELWDES
jgi:hypothetical protein